MKTRNEIIKMNTYTWLKHFGQIDTPGRHDFLHAPKIFNARRENFAEIFTIYRWTGLRNLWLIDYFFCLGELCNQNLLSDSQADSIASGLLSLHRDDVVLAIEILITNVQFKNNFPNHESF